MSKILKNNTVNDVILQSTGQTILGSGQLTIDPSHYPEYANSSEVISYISDLTFTVNDGSQDLSIANGTRLIQGIFPAFEIDSDGRQISRQAATKKGWRYLAHVIELETSKLSGCFSANWQGISRTDFIMKFYNSSNTELVAGTQAELDSNCVKTIVTIKPSHDYDIIGGNIHQHTTPVVDIRLWVAAGAVELGALGMREFVGGLNMKFMGVNEQIETDGRASARMVKDTVGIPYQTNQMQYIITHPIGHNHQLMVVIEYFRE